MAEAKTAFVRDIHAKAKKRPHEIVTKMVNGEILERKTYDLSAHEDTEMPYDHALKFLVSDGFIVTDKTGHRIRPIEKREADMGAFKLKPDEVIANLDELSQDALFKRAKILPGSEDIKVTDKKETIIAFLLDSKKAANPAGVSPGSEGKIGELDSGTLDQLFEDNN